MKVGFAPITWNNEDLQAELGPPVPFETVLDEVVACGYTATELGDGFPHDAASLREALRVRNLSLPSAWCGLAFFSGSADEDLRRTRDLSQLLSAVGATFVNLADVGTRERKAWAGRTDDPRAPHLSAAEWDAFAERVCACAEMAREFGLQATFHAHAGTWVETRADLEELLRRTPSDLVKLVFDVGHALYGGMDPIEVVQAYPERIAYIHLKDLDSAVLDRLRREQLGFDDGIRRRVFCELGRGALDVPRLLGALREAGYDGWLMVEQDSTWLPPAESARVSRAYLRSLGI
jgi:inosose dehydratase